ncbi:MULTISPECIES: hypothetical protein [Streptomyces]|uniref:Uncharacterized protein n=1 Tax=Streptomyces fradiae ATCC 10745 = DSM 40063 TaxID=1319510 RepID=A0A1Y2NWF5_STRFR|nr:MULTISPECIES: hypothetical protein [Streptomyces]KAF0649208.1 hypothetical protein K701_13960 [Streptomyces fradiae ATCC 10745 = DSM 40063]OSY51836.1 hypothetical protein BG846_02510 [Streptomyces fradiae ATCC 10745 = DSM 40063]QEV12016.1 hypothetical protein CP974_08295 [Streptomyces fradiae ATCC 10745 = DSM 40063]
MRLTVTDADVARKARELGLLKEGEVLPAHLRSRVVAALLQEQTPRVRAAADVPLAQSIRVQPGTGVEIDGRPFPWLIQAETIEVVLDPSGSGLVRLTIPTQSVEITKSESE